MSKSYRILEIHYYNPVNGVSKSQYIPQYCKSFLGITYYVDVAPRKTVTCETFEEAKFMIDWLSEAERVINK